MVSFRAVQFPTGLRGQIWLHSMPGRYDSLEDSWREIRRLGVSWIVCLAPLAEISKKSPAYATAIEKGEVPCQIRHLAIPDYGAPDDDSAFAQCVREAADALRQGKHILVHCGAGIGRTSMFAIATLVALGLSHDQARHEVSAVGSGPERPVQEEAIIRFIRAIGDNAHIDQKQEANGENTCPKDS
jgi:protein-tyrosine phosphatase